MSYLILPCNGLDKSAGPLSREAALRLIEHDGGELVCPVLLGNSPDRYGRVLKELSLLVIDGCATGQLLRRHVASERESLPPRRA